MLLVAAATAWALAAEPQCSLHLPSCYYSVADFDAAETYNRLSGRANGQVNYSTMCDSDFWAQKESCDAACPVQVLITEPPELRMSMCAADNSFAPYNPQAHIDLYHPLNGKEIELVAPGGADDDVMRMGCNLDDFATNNFTGKFVVMRRGLCYFAMKFQNAYAAGAVAGLMINSFTDNRVEDQLLQMIGNSEGQGPTPALSAPRHYGDILFGALDAGKRVVGKIQVVCDRSADTGRAVITDDCPSPFLVPQTDNIEDAPCYNEQGSARRLCVRCPVEMTHAATNVTVCLWGSYLVPRLAANYLQMSRTMPIVGQDVVILRSDVEPCNPASFSGLAGRVVAYVRSSRCLPYDSLRAASAAGTAAVIVMTSPAESEVEFVEGPSEFVTIPVHSVTFYQTARVLALRSTGQPLTVGGTVVGDVVRVDLREGSMPPDAPTTPPPAPPPPPLEPLASEDDSLQWSVAWTVPFALAVVLAVCVVVAVARQRVAAAQAANDYDAIDTGGGCTVPLGVASTALSLSIVVTIAVVAFLLAYLAGQEGTDDAIAEGKVATLNTYNSTVRNLDSLSADLRRGVVTNIVSSLNDLFTTAEVQVRTAATLYLSYDLTWAEFAERYNDLVEVSRTTSVRLSFLSTNGFYASEKFLTLNTTAAPTGGRGLDFQSHFYDDSLMVNKVWAIQAAEEFDPTTQVGGTRGINRHDLVRRQRRGDFMWHATREVMNHAAEDITRPLAVYTPVFSRVVDAYLGVAEASLSFNSVVRALNSARDSFRNATVVVFDKDTRVVFGTNVYATSTYPTQYMTISMTVNQGSYTLQNIPPTELNALNHYLDEVEDELDGRIHSASFDQAEYYEALTTAYVTQLALVPAPSASGYALEDVSGMKYPAEMRDGACVDALAACVTPDATARGGAALQFYGDNKLYIYSNLTTDLDVVQATKVDRPDGKWESSMLHFGNIMPLNGTGKQCVVHTEASLGITECMLREFPLNTPHTVQIRFKPDAKPDADRTGWLISQTFRGNAELRIFETGAVFVSVLQQGCRTSPIADIAARGWTTITASIDPVYGVCASYVDGELYDVSRIASIQGATRQPVTDPLTVGGNGYRGLVSEVSILNVSVSSAEAWHLHSRGAYVRDVPSRIWYAEVTPLQRDYGIDWLVASLVPRDDIMREVDANNILTNARLAVSEKNLSTRLGQRTAEACVVLAALILAAVLVLIVFNARLTEPFTHVARLMTDAAYMCITEVPETTSSIHELRTMYAAMGKMLRNLEAFRPYLPDSLFEDTAFIPKGKRETAPGLSTGVVCLVFTDIQSSTALWEASEDGMKKGLKIHNDVMRECIAMYNGYEVKTVGDCFMVAFHSAQEACNFALHAQLRLHEATWPENLLRVPHAEVDHSKDLRGIRVRIGINFGEAECEFNPVLKRYDYFGSTVNKASRVEGAGVGGSVAITNDVMEELLAQDDDPLMGLMCQCEQVTLVNVPLKGCAETVDLTMLVPQTLRLRAMYVQDTVRKRQLDIEKQTKANDNFKVSFDDRSSRRSSLRSAEFNNTTSAGSRMARMTNAAVGKLYYTFSGDFLLNPMARSSLNACVAKISNCLRRTEGVLVGVLASSVVVSWNAAKPVSMPTEWGIRFAKMMYNSSFGTSRVDFLNTLHFGLCGGAVLQGSIGNKAQRFITAVGPAVSIAEQLCTVAASIDVYCLYAQTHQQTLPEGLRMRPIDEWATAGCSPLQLTVHEVMVVVSRVDHASDGMATPANARGLASVPSGILHSPANKGDQDGNPMYGRSVSKGRSLKDEMLDALRRRAEAQATGPGGDTSPNQSPHLLPKVVSNAALTSNGGTSNTGLSPDIHIQISDRDPSFGIELASPAQPSNTSFGTGTITGPGLSPRNAERRVGLDDTVEGSDTKNLSPDPNSFRSQDPNSFRKRISQSASGMGLLKSSTNVFSAETAVRSTGSFTNRFKPQTPALPARFQWGWTEEYVEAFRKGDWETITQRSDDPVLGLVAENIRENKHFTLPLRW